MSTAAVLVDRSRVPHQGAGWHLGSNYTTDYLVTAGRMKCFPVAGTRLQTAAGDASSAPQNHLLWLGSKSSELVIVM